ncbi:MAG: rod shape-determining protein MreC [Alphaproteobacteria bacterium]|nr:rod shape-determining protein MreC [Alphaproteobacteria bacterium]
MRAPGRIFRMTVPFRAAVQRFANLLLAAAAVGLMLLGRVENPSIEKLRTTATDFAAPVMTALSEPIVTARRLIAEADDLLHLRERNALLGEENARLLQWQAVARRLEQENAALRAQLAARPDPHAAFITARVVGDSGSPFLRTLLVAAGQRDGVRPGQAAIVAEGAVGRIVEAGDRSSRLLLFTDLNSRVPVILEQTRQRAVLAGDNGPVPKLIFLSPGPRPPAGERVVTSGHDGLLPPGLPIGQVVATAGGDPRVELSAPLGRVEYVRLVRYEVPRVPASPRETQPPGKR